MRLTTLLIISFSWLFTSSASHSFAEGRRNASGHSERIKNAVKRSLPYLKKQGQWWLNNKKCASCHRLTFLPQILREANRRGISDEMKSLKYWREESLQSTNKKNNLLGLSQLILGRDPVEKANHKLYDQFALTLIKGQKKNGSWKAEGQLPAQKRSLNESVEVATMWNFLALCTISSNKEEVERVKEKAMKFIQTKKDGISIEWHSTRLLMTLQSVDKNSQLISLRLQKLQKLQNADGGWGWIAGEKSDALATGYALYALSQPKLKRDQTAHQNAIEWLLKNQTKSGKWLVPGTKKKKKDKPQETANYWGTIWATLGLMESLPDKQEKLSHTSN